MDEVRSRRQGQVLRFPDEITRECGKCVKLSLGHFLERSQLGRRTPFIRKPGHLTQPPRPAGLVIWALKELWFRRHRFLFCSEQTIWSKQTRSYAAARLLGVRVERPVRRAGPSTRRPETYLWSTLAIRVW